jgi:biopolymer transport protein TolR
VRKPLVEQVPTVSRINVTPIIDVALVLVIILLITAPMIAITDMEIALPKAQTRSVNSDKRIVVTLGASGRLAIDDSDIPAEALERLLKTRLSGKDNKDMMVIVRADENVPYTVVELVLEQAQAAGAKRLAIATEQWRKVNHE